MENLVQAWLVRVEHFSAEVSRKRAELNEIRKGNLDLKAAAEEDQHLLARLLTALQNSDLRRTAMATCHALCRTELALCRLTTAGTSVICPSRERNWLKRYWQLEQRQQAGTTATTTDL